jgi:hypothetical protein
VNRHSCGAVADSDRVGNYLRDNSAHSKGTKLEVRRLLSVVLKGIIMETEHTQSVVERAYAFVEDMFGLEHERQAPEEPFETVGQEEMRRYDDCD